MAQKDSTCWCSDPSKAQAGFTLIELIVTMVIIGIMAITVLPRMDLLRGFDEIGFRDQVRSALEYARKSAVAGRRNVQVAIAANTLTVTRQTQTPEGAGAAGWVALNLPGINSNVIAAPTSMAAIADVAITFDPLGRSAGGVIAIPGAGNITIEAETGYVR